MLNNFRMHFTRYASEHLQNNLHTKQMWHKPVGKQTGIKIYHCGKRSLVPLILHSDYMASWYTCGPTVYDTSHIGHASCYVKIDIIQRILRNHFRINLVTAMNITDIDDKILQKSETTGIHWQDISKQYEAEFWADMRKLNIIEPNLKTRVTDNIPEIIKFITTIISKGLAYVGNDGSVYFNVKKFPDYGKLQKVNLDQNFIANSQGEISNKAADADFVLWKAKKSLSEPSWNSPWKEGRPGWHIECSALASMIFGSEIDFHAGGLDLKFPHHENEEAQSCVYHDTYQWVNYWLHTGQLNIKGDVEKMSKSLKNTINIDHMLQYYSADEFRMACLLSNYRNAMEYSDSMMENARNILKKFISFRDDCEAYYGGKKRSSAIDSNAIFSKLAATEEQVDIHFKDDFNTARVIEVLLELSSEINRNMNLPTNISTTTATCFDAVAAVDNFVGKCLKIFGLKTFDKITIDRSFGLDINILLQEILSTRNSIRKEANLTKNKELFELCDQLRNCLRNSGIEIKDHDNGSSWTFSPNKR